MPKVTLDVKGCKSCPFFRDVNTGREGWLQCEHPKHFDGAYGKVINGNPKVAPRWCPLGLGKEVVCKKKK